ncbi:MAG: protein tyrosine phosphatase [Myxococcota bacterium]|nr:protein tyrosine phosphatase [Myxococcota bacterium]MDW8361393.1 CpsB/CapC family capsule biosynthesis tyrosine phosphatase [Myxococcales bacterium]
MSGWVDLHCHYLPGVDDGVRSVEDAIALLRGLAALGWERVVATPHVRTGMFDNRRPGLQHAAAALEDALSAAGPLPARGLAAEHWFDEVFWALFERGEALPYPGGQAVLVEFPVEAFPVGLADRLFRMSARGVRPVLAHPERYAPLWSRSEPLLPLLDAGACALLDLMSLTGRYGERARRAAERMLDEGLYEAACTDCHRAADVATVEQALERLTREWGGEATRRLLSHGPRALLAEVDAA